MQVFSHAWFRRNQRTLITVLNLPGLGRECRRALGLSVDGRMVAVYPHASIRACGDMCIGEFFSRDLVAKRMHREFAGVWQLAHWFDQRIANTLCPALNLGFDTLTAYPDANPETATVDGYAWRSGVDETFATIVSAAGTQALDTDPDLYAVVWASTTTDQFKEIDRMIFLFDTSAIGGGNISDAILSLWGLSKTGALGAPPLHACASSPAGNTSVGASDFATMGSTSFGNIAWASLVSTDTAYSDITINASGLAAINKTGVTKLGARIEWDINASFTGTWGSTLANVLQVASAENASGTAKAPKLTVTFTPSFAWMQQTFIGQSQPVRYIPIS
jgi:hypothetical protein